MTMLGICIKGIRIAQLMATTVHIIFERIVAWVKRHIAMCKKEEAHLHC